MKIKNKDQLIERAKAHRAADEVVFLFDWYSAPVVTNGRIEWFFGSYDEWVRRGAKISVCAVGCLALPVGLDDAERYEYGENQVADMAHSIEEDFGVPEWLQYLAEENFLLVERGLNDLEPNDPKRQKRLSQFVVDFTEALPENVDLGTSSCPPDAWAELDYESTPEGFLDALRNLGKVPA